MLVLLKTHQVRVSRETVRRWLAAEQVAWRRPRPVVGPKDPQRARKLAELRAFLAGLPADEAAVFQDEVDVNSNPKVGCMWMPKGKQATVLTQELTGSGVLIGNATHKYSCPLVACRCSWPGRVDR